MIKQLKNINQDFTFTGAITDSAAKTSPNKGFSNIQQDNVKAAGHSYNRYDMAQKREQESENTSVKNK